MLLVAAYMLDRCASRVALEMIQRLQLRAFVEEDIPLNKPWQVRANLVSGVAARGDAEDVVEFFEGALSGNRQQKGFERLAAGNILGLRDEKKDNCKGEEVKAGIEAEC